MYKLLYIFFSFRKDYGTFMLYFVYILEIICPWIILYIIDSQQSVVIPVCQKTCDVISSGMALVNTLFNMLNIVAAHQKTEQRGAEWHVDPGRQ